MSDADRPAPEPSDRTTDPTPEASDGSGDLAPETAYPTPEATAAKTDGFPSALEAAALGCGIGRDEKSARSHDGTGSAASAQGLVRERRGRHGSGSCGGTLT